MAKIKTDELNKIKGSIELQTQFTTRLGDTELQILTLKETKKNILNKINGIIEERTQYLEQLKETYGDGTLNIDTGEFTVTK